MKKLAPKSPSRKVIKVLVLGTVIILVYVADYLIGSYINHRDETKVSYPRGPIIESNPPSYLHPFKGSNPPDSNIHIDEPIIYFYPQTVQKTLVRLIFNGQLVSSYPSYDSSIMGWNIVAYPDGSLLDTQDNQKYNYLFWEGVMNDITFNFNLKTGFVVAGKDTAAFLRTKLAEIGLNEKESNDFIVYWLPKMQNNKYNLIHFAGKEYTDKVNLEISPTPDSLLRVYMVFLPLDNYLNIEPQTFTPFQRKGFTVVEWGGSDLTGK